MSQEISVASQYFDFAGKRVLDIIKLMKILLDQNKASFDDKVQKRLLETLEFYEKFLNESQKNEICCVPNLSKADKEAIEYYQNEILGDKLKDNIGDFSMPVLMIPTGVDPESNKLTFGMILRQQDVPKLYDMCSYFRDNGIPTDNLSVKDISVVNNPNSLFNPDKNIQKGEIEIPLAYENVFKNLTTFMQNEGYDFDIAPHDNSMSIIYDHRDQQRLLNQIYDDKNNGILWDTKDEKEINSLKKMVILDGDKTLNDRESQKDKLFNNNKER